VSEIDGVVVMPVGMPAGLSPPPTPSEGSIQAGAITKPPVEGWRKFPRTVAPGISEKPGPVWAGDWADRDIATPGRVINKNRAVHLMTVKKLVVGGNFVHINS